MIRYLPCIALLSLFISTAGCGTPSDLPPLATFQIKVVKGGTPVEGAIVSVHSDSLPNKYGCYGITNANGFLSLKTYFHTEKRDFAGAPVGSLRIGVRRAGDFGLEDPRKATKGMSRDESYAYNIDRSKRIAANEKFVPLALSDPLISPIEFTVETQKTNELTIELDDPRWNIKIDPKRLKKYRSIDFTP